MKQWSPIHSSCTCSIHAWWSSEESFNLYAKQLCFQKIELLTWRFIGSCFQGSINAPTIGLLPSSFLISSLPVIYTNTCPDCSMPLHYAASSQVTDAHKKTSKAKACCIYTAPLHSKHSLGNLQFNYAGYILPPPPPASWVLNLLTSEGWKVEWTLSLWIWDWTWVTSRVLAAVLQYNHYVTRLFTSQYYFITIFFFSVMLMSFDRIISSSLHSQTICCSKDDTEVNPSVKTKNPLVFENFSSIYFAMSREQCKGGI